MSSPCLLSGQPGGATMGRGGVIMPIRIANKTTLRHALVLALLLAGVAGNSLTVWSQKNAIAPRPNATSITITGATRLYHPAIQVS